MTQENQTPRDPRGELRLKLPEPDVSAEEPWGDDVLDRAQIAAKLTNLIRDQSAPFAISIHGYWGTGKTFMLKRWQKDLENQDFKAIYFNAWEDDFCDDPLLAIIGQLSEYFTESNLKSFADQVVQVAIPLLQKNLLGVLNKATGISLEIAQKEQSERDLLKEYLDQRASKDELKNHLQDLAGEVVEKTGHPLVFIIDELDRCRPTFAIELLERVKHIFDVPNMVFVFGVNRDELCKSLSSVYGDIDVDVYLRRFFDMEFILPEVDSAKFGRHLMQNFGLEEFFGELSKSADHRLHNEEFGVLVNNFPSLWGRLGLSLRDIDYCVRLIALVGNNLELHQYMHPWLLGLLIPLKLKNLAMYRQFIQGQYLASQVMDYLDTILSPQGPRDRLEFILDAIEAELYLAESRNAHAQLRESTALTQLELIQQGQEPSHPEYLSRRTGNSSAQRAGQLMRMIQSDIRWPPPAISISYLANLIDLHQELVRR